MQFRTRIVCQRHGRTLSLFDIRQFVFVDVGERKLHCFELHVQAVGRIDGERAHVDVLQDTERDEGTDALTVRRNFMQREVAVVLRERLDPVALMGREVLHRHRAAVLFRMLK